MHSRNPQGSPDPSRESAAQRCVRNKLLFASPALTLSQVYNDFPEAVQPLTAQQMGGSRPVSLLLSQRSKNVSLGLFSPSIFLENVLVFHNLRYLN